MFTANTMGSIAEAIGMRLPGSASPPAIDAATSATRATRRRRGGQPRPRITPRQIMTKHAFENAIALIIGARRIDQRGAAPARLANEARVELDLDDFNRIAASAAHRRHEARSASST